MVVEREVARWVVLTSGQKNILLTGLLGNDVVQELQAKLCVRYVSRKTRSRLAFLT